MDLGDPPKEYMIYNSNVQVEFQVASHFPHLHVALSVLNED